MESGQLLVVLPTAERLFYSRSLDRELLLDFFMLFSRLECALKRAGYARTQGEAVAPAWRRFADHAQAAWAASDGPSLPATLFLVGNPPLRQVLRDTQLGWEDTPAQGSPLNFLHVLELVKTVRNNRFHGGKYPMPSQPVADPARDSALVEASLLILRNCVSLVPEVANAFPDDY